MSKANNNESLDSTNPFKLMNQVDELPPKLKAEVMATIYYANLVVNVGKLFSVDMIRSASDMIDPSPKDENNDVE